MSYNADEVLNKIEYEGPEGIEWFQAEDAFDPDGEADLYDAINDARSGWAAFNRALRQIEDIAVERGLVEA